MIDWKSKLLIYMMYIKFEAVWKIKILYTMCFKNFKNSSTFSKKIRFKETDERRNLPSITRKNHLQLNRIANRKSY